MKCDCQECQKEAIGAVGIAFYPPKAVMNYHKTDRWLTRLVMGLCLCQQHLNELEPFELIPRDKMQAFANLIEKSSKTAVDLEACKIVSVSFTDPEYLALLRSRDVRNN